MTTVEWETLSACPVCGSSDLRPWRTIRDRGRAEVAPSLVYLSCGRCRAVALRDRVAERALGALYPDNYEPYTSLPARSSSSTRHPLRALIGSAFQDPAQQKIEQFYTVPRGGRRRLLDFGCGSPAFLVRAHAWGWDPVGVDFPESVLENVREAGFAAHSVAEARSTFEPGSFDMVRMNHVLEHLYDPRETLTWLRGLLRAGGTLHIAVPNPAGVSARLFRQHWKALEPRHVILYPPQTLVTLLQDTGFTRVSIVHEALSKDAVRSAGLVVASHTRQTVAQAMRWSDNRIAAELLRPVAWLLARLRMADRYHAFAQV